MVFCSLIFVLLVGPFLLTLNLSRTIASPDYVKRSINGADLYQKIVSVDSKELADFFSGGNPNADAPPPEFIDQLKKAIGQEDIKQAFEKNFDGAVTALKEGKSEYSIDISNLKTRLVRGADSPELSQYFGQIKEKFPVHFPDFIVSFAKAIKYSSLIILIVGLFLCLLLASSILLARGARSKVRTASLLFLITAIVATIPAVLGYVIDVPLPNLGLPQSIFQAISDVLNNLKDGLARLFALEAAIFAVLAVVLFIIGFFVPRAKLSPSGATTAPVQPPDQK